MKKINFYILLTIFALSISCSSEEEKKEEKTNTEKKSEAPLIEIKGGVYTEYYPGHKLVKIQGQVDDNEFRNGQWIYYSETGLELSISNYSHGVKEGHSIVKYPDGTIHYYGEYRNDEKVGVWKTYDEKGKLVTEMDFKGL